MVSSTTKMAPDSVASGAFVNWPGAGCGGAAGICGGATKFSMVRGLAASCTVKSVFFRSRTGAPSPLVTLTVRRTLSCAIAGSTDKAQIVKQNRIARIFMRTNPPECSQKSGTHHPLQNRTACRSESDLPVATPAMVARAVYASVGGGTVTKLTTRGLTQVKTGISCRDTVSPNAWEEGTTEASQK